MIPLIKIRLTYIKRNYCKCFFNYFATAVLLLIILIFIIIVDNSRRYLKEDFGPDLLEKYPSNQILKSNSIGIISEEENIFKEFNKANKKENLSLELTYFKKESDIRQYDKYQSIIECIKIKEKIYQFKIKNYYISLSKSI